jgi:hypothetical protein
MKTGMLAITILYQSQNQHEIPARVFNEDEICRSVLLNRVMKSGKLAITILFQNQNPNEIPARVFNEDEIERTGTEGRG